MKEPTYVFKKGDGWIPLYPSNFEWTQDSCAGTWVTLGRHIMYWYPQTCQNFQYFHTIEHTDLQVGDAIPYGDRMDIIQSIDEDDGRGLKITVKQVFKRWQTPITMSRWVYGTYEGVVRP